MKIKLFTHTDLDGIGCSILGILAFGKENIDITYCDYNNVNEKILEFIDGATLKNYDKIFITDISVNDTVSAIINGFYEVGYKFQLLDHHPTALELNKYDWVKVIIEDKIEKVSGTSLFYKYLEDNKIFINRTYKIENMRFELNFFHDLDRFVEKVKRYDTWLWSTKYNDLEAKQLNDLFYILGRDKFINKMLKTLGEFDDIDKLLLELEQDKINHYIKKKNKEIVKNTLILDKSYNVGIVFAEQYLSQLGNELAKMNKDLDFIIMISNCKTISYRGIKSNIDLGKLAEKYYSGGGHPMAAGSQIKEKVKDRIINLILNI